MPERNEVNVAILTPYLVQPISEINEALLQMICCAYDPDNLEGIKAMATPRHLVRLHSPHFKKGGLVSVVDARNIARKNKINFAIAGCTEDAESEVMNVTESGENGLIVARYSIFYSGPSRYTDSLPEESGYALDIPKEVSAAKELLTDDDFLEAIVAREESRARHAIANLNRSLRRPVIITPHFARAIKRPNYWDGGL